MTHKLMLKDYLKCMINKANIMGHTTKQVHTRIDEILKEYGVGNFYPGTFKSLKRR